MEIRQYQEKDKAAVTAICLGNADMGTKMSKVDRYVQLMFCDYYIECEPENCFVAVEDDDIPFGYVYGALDYDTYAKAFMEKYYPRIRKLSLYRSICAKTEMRDHAIYKEKYPAHLHIDVLEGRRSGGAGSQLITRFCENVKEKGAQGVMLIVGKENGRGQNFYRKNHFDELHSKKTGVAMGKLLK